MFLVVDIVCSLITTQECRNTTKIFIPHKTSQQAHTRLVTTFDLRHSCLDIRVSSLLNFNKHHLRRYYTKPPSFTRDLRHTSVNTTDSQDYSLNTPGKNTTPFRLYTLYQKIQELSGYTK